MNKRTKIVSNTNRENQLDCCSYDRINVGIHEISIKMQKSFIETHYKFSYSLLD